MSTVPFTPVEVLGYVRPVVQVRFDGHTLPMMVHSYASFTMQLKHAQAAAFSVQDLKPIDGRYGIERAGKASALAPSRGIVASVQVGGSTDHDVPVSVFEVPQDQYGMLGVGWIRRNRVIIDYATQTLTVAPTQAHASALQARLKRAGYSAIPMTFDRERGYFDISASIGGVVRKLTVATASSTEIDPAFAKLAGVRRGAQFAVGSGPTGTSTPRYRLAQPVVVRIAGWTSQPLLDAQIVDNYAYADQTRPADVARWSGGTLGSPFLMQARAVIDFGNNTLYLK